MGTIHDFELGKLMYSERFSDMTLVCDGHEFKVHKVVVCSQSPVLAAAVTGSFKEAKTGVVNIAEFDSETVRRMVDYLYTGDYSISHSKPDDSAVPTEVDRDLPALRDDMLQHVRVNAIADYYGLTKLVDLANSRLRESCETDWDAQSFLSAAQEVLSHNGDKVIHKTLAIVASENMKDLLKYDRFDDLVGDFGSRVLGRQHRKTQQMEVEIHDKTIKLDIVQTALDNEKARSRHTEEEIRNVLQKLNDTKRCRNPSCDAIFSCSIDRQVRLHGSGGFILRCSKCACKQ